MYLYISKGPFNLAAVTDFADLEVVLLDLESVLLAAERPFAFGSCADLARMACV